VQKITVFAAGIVTSSGQKEAARALISYLSSKPACPIIQDSALEPVACAPAHQ
jgi:hypothetical protein